MTFQEFAAANGWTLSAVARDRPDADEWSVNAVHFLVTINGPRGVVWRGPYSVGSAYPMLWAQKATKGRARQLWAQYIQAGGTAYKAQQGRDTVAQAEVRDEITREYRKAAPIEIGDILESLQLDAAGADQPFADWCADLGYDTDSRKALAAYEACRKTMFALRSACDFDSFLSIEG